MKKLMTKRFILKNYKQELYIRLLWLQQQNLTIKDYVREFKTLMLKCNLHEPQEQTMVRFLVGLNKEIAHVVELQHYYSLEDVIRLALKVEK